MVSMTSLQEILLFALIILIIAVVVIGVVFLRFGKGLANRIFGYITPVIAICVVMAFILGKIGLHLESAPLILAIGAAISVVMMFLLYRATVTHLVVHVQTLNASSAQLASTAKQSAATAAQQATMVSEVSTTVEELLQTSSAASASAGEVMKVAGEAVEQSRKGMTAMAEATRIMELISKTSALVETVGELAEQSKLLAVNASIEAAKAGEQGRGFAVVAAEVRSLSEQSKAAARQIREAIQRTEEGRHAIALVSSVIDRLTGVLEDASDKAQHIASATAQQVSGIQQITEAMTSVSQGGQETAAGARQIESSAGLIKEIGAQLQVFVGGKG
jgi:methyl-accepting chemotaxis protein